MPIDDDIYEAHSAHKRTDHAGKARTAPRTSRGQAGPVTVKRLDGTVIATVGSKRLRRGEGVREA